MTTGIEGAAHAAPALRLDAEEPFLLYAWSDPTPSGQQVVTVYRSVELRDTDELYQPVKDFLAAHEVVETSRVEVEDESMMFGRAEKVTYLVGAVRV